ncbi:MAG: hypothetical protein JWO98_4778, partial [Frankiales bacterium]|nr:hypothetical protein [Frankiales bacterium]
MQRGRIPSETPDCVACRHGTEDLPDNSGHGWICGERQQRDSHRRSRLDPGSPTAPSRSLRHGLILVGGAVHGPSPCAFRSSVGRSAGLVRASWASASVAASRPNSATEIRFCLARLSNARSSMAWIHEALTPRVGQMCSLDESREGAAVLPLRAQGSAAGIDGRLPDTSSVRRERSTLLWRGTPRAVPVVLAAWQGAPGPLVADRHRLRNRFPVLLTFRYLPASRTPRGVSGRPGASTDHRTGRRSGSRTAGTGCVGPPFGCCSPSWSSSCCWPGSSAACGGGLRPGRPSCSRAVLRSPTST